MKYDYYPFDIDPSRTIFNFKSESPLKIIRKRVFYDLVLPERQLYNLSLADILPNGKSCDLTVSDNKDMHKIIATVIKTLFIFFEAYDKSQVFVTGSTPTRTRLYRAVIGRELSEAQKFFEIYGCKRFASEPFKKDGDYDGFTITLNTSGNAGRNQS